MSNHNPSPKITLFHYPFSPWSQKITLYLALRRIPYVSCIQPVTLPRPELKSRLGVNYRRIPVLSIGRDIYCDTLIMLEKLEELYPYSADEVKRHGKTGTERALEKLLEKWTDVVVFKYAAAAIPTTLEAVRDKGFVSDRTELWGRDWDPKHQDSLRPEGLTALRANVKFLEESVLEDGREWVLGGKEMTLGDVHAAWIFVWLSEMDGALPESIFGRKEYPKTWAWWDRYSKSRDAALEAMIKDGLRVEEEGKVAIPRILAGGFGEKEGQVDERDPTGLKKGELVRGYPTDTGFNHKDIGRLVALTPQEAVIGSKGEGGVEVRIHHPRWQFLIEPERGGDVNGGSNGEQKHLVSEGAYVGGRE
jgi:glutathione S-transferase